jgi:sensor histidine kinase regulating citrate/malate metabolism
MGLYLVTTIVFDFNGTVRVENRVKGDHTKGARFIVMLPVVEK